MFDVRCTGCHRLETWNGDPPTRVEVRLDGGARKPVGSPSRAAWSALSSILADPERTVFGACDLCGQPRAASALVDPRPYDLHVNDVIYVVTDKVVGPDGPLEDPARVIEPRLPKPTVQGTSSWLGALLAGLFGVTMFACWLSAMWMVVWFLIRGAQSGELFQFR